VRSLLASLRRKLLGETWTIPLGVCSAILLALLARGLLPHDEWRPVGGFALAAPLIATLVRSLSTDSAARATSGRPHPPHRQTPTRSDR
jgi:hypothetical protein